MMTPATDGPVISCQIAGCSWAMEDFAGENGILGPLMQTFVSHHFAEAHPDHVAERHDFSPEQLLAECREVFEHYGVDPDNPYEQLTPALGAD